MLYEMQPVPDKPLSNPTRLAIVERLSSVPAASLDDLAESAGVHRNTARAHVDALEQAGIVERTTAAVHHGAGRPRTLYRLSAAAQATEPAPLATLLGGALGASGLSRPQAQRLARLRALTAKRPRRRAAAQELEAQLRDLGFAAHVEGGEVRLERCPCPVVAPDNPAVVCALVAGTVDGTLERLGAEERVRASSHDPVARHCILRLGSEPTARPGP